MSDNIKFRQLLQRYIDDQLTDAEEEDLFALLNREDHQVWLQQAIDGLFSQPVGGPSINPQRLDQIRAHILASGQSRPKRVFIMRRWWAAASILLLLATGAYFLAVHKPPARMAATMEIAPGRNGAVLTLSDGSQVVLDSLGNGVVATQNGAQITLGGDQLVYGEATGKATGSIAYNIMTTPKGRQFRLLLPDGTKVWLNAASSLKYPTAFAGKERKVEVTGEAYFEVAKDAKMPFRVNVNNKAEVEVLGTHFNVNAYTNEASINATLLEGSVSVTRYTSANRNPPVGQPAQPLSQVILKPGQQAQLENVLTGQGSQPAFPSIRVVNSADVDRVMAWKNGLFNFEGASLEEVMRQLERWYDIDVVYEKGVPDIRFVGKMKKNIPLKDLLEILERTRVHFRLENEKRLVVIP